jgi:hypothetical protein
MPKLLPALLYCDCNYSWLQQVKDSAAAGEVQLAVHEALTGEQATDEGVVGPGTAAGAGAAD